MRLGIFILILLVPFRWILGQAGGEHLEGTITYKSSQNVYVTFESTEGLEAGDTIYISKEGALIPVLAVKSLSSISCVCEPLSTMELSLSQKLVAMPRAVPAVVIPVVASKEEAASMAGRSEGAGISDTINSVADSSRRTGEGVHGRISVSSYSDFSDQEAGNHQRMRYVLALNARKIGGSRLSFDSYISFRHSDDNWSDIQDNIYNGLKVYNLSLNYEFSQDMNLWLGRRINPKLSSMGAIDGVQFERRFGSFTAGVIAGSRPDWEDYSFNASLFQAGAYVNHQHRTDHVYLESTAAFVDQENDWNTDRRFLYLQHINRLMGKLFFFGSAEIDLYKYTNDKKETSFRLTNLYASLMYKVIRQLSFSLSYSARNNIIYYETYKTYIDRLLELETMQGFIFSVNARPVNMLSLGVRAGYRYRKEDLRPSRNLQGYVNINRSQSLPVTVSLMATMLEASYIKGREYGVRLSRDFLKGMLYAAAGYRNTSYDFYSNETSAAQNCIDLNLSLNAPWKMYFSINYEATLDKEYTFNRLYVNLTKRF